MVRKLLRPCISLTSIVQEGKGIYNHDIKNNDNVDNSNDNNEHIINDNNNIIDTNSSSILLTKNENTNREEKNEIKKTNSSSDCTIEVDACTFDKVLLYLEHEVRPYVLHDNSDGIISTFLISTYHTNRFPTLVFYSKRHEIQ